MRAYHFDLAFQIKARTKYQVVIVAIAAVVNIALNYWWIPIFGVMGSAYATLMAYAITLGLSMHLGRKFIKIPFLNKE